MSKVLVAIDLSYQTYRAASAHGKLRSLEDEFTGGLYGFAMTVARILNVTQATHAVVCEDVKPYRRSDFYPEYKQLRASTADPDLKEKYLISVQQVKEMCSVIGIPIISVPGFESDDIIGHLALTQRHRFDHIYAASNDSDLFTLLDLRSFKVYRKDESDIMDRERLWKETGLRPEEFATALALMGTHNDVEGIKGVGPKTAYKAVKDPQLMRTYQDRHAKLIERNLRLIKLPYEGFPDHLQLPPPTNSFHARTLYRWFARYDINATASMLDAFERVCP